MHTRTNMHTGLICLVNLDSDPTPHKQTHNYTNAHKDTHKQTHTCTPVCLDWSDSGLIFIVENGRKLGMKTR